MKNKFYWIDLAVCSVWILAILGDRHTCNSVQELIVILTVVMRITFTFAIVRNEKRAWVPLVGMIVTTVLMLQSTYFMGVDNMAYYAFPILNIKSDINSYRLIAFFCVLWVWILPPVLYFIRLFRRKLVRTDAKWKDMLGTILWNDKTARTYSALMLTCIITFYTGLAMSAKACRVVCLVLPILSYWLICHHYQIRPKRLWLLVVSMTVFYYAQPFAGLWRIIILSVSLAMVIYMTVQLYQATDKLVLSILTVFYIGMFLPSLAIGYNQYACIRYGRQYYYSHAPYNGIFYIKDISGEKQGLRDRYGVLVEPEYDGIYHPDGNGGLVEIELRKNGHSEYYDPWTGEIRKNDEINEDLQAEICKDINAFVDKYTTDYDDRIEVKVTEFSTSKVLSHVKVAMYGLPFYSYKDTVFLPEDTVKLLSGEVYCDTLVLLKHSQKKMISYALDLKRDSVPMYRITLKIAQNKLPPKSMAEELADSIFQNEFFSKVKKKE